jgi:hypothetical protein
MAGDESGGPMNAQGHTPGQVQGILTHHERASIAACRDLKDPERDVAEMRDALIRISNLDDHSAVRVLAVGIAQDVLARIKARAPEGTP